MTKTEFDFLMNRLERQGLLDENISIDLDTLVHLIDRRLSDDAGRI